MLKEELGCRISDPDGQGGHVQNHVGDLGRDPERSPGLRDPGASDRSVVVPEHIDFDHLAAGHQGFELVFIFVSGGNKTGIWLASLFSDEQSLEAISRSEEHTSELQSLMRISYAVFCLKKKNKY